MINHVVFFQFKPSVKEPEIKKLEERLGALPAVIPEIKRYEFGRELVHSDRSFDFALVSSFDDMDAIRRYIAHPEHQKVLELVGEICSAVKSVDFESGADGTTRG